MFLAEVTKYPRHDGAEDVADAVGREDSAVVEPDRAAAEIIRRRRREEGEVSAEVEADHRRAENSSAGTPPM